jgi:membrane protein YqaA with SNARE-associated domain
MHHFFKIVLLMGWAGPLVLGIADSSFLVLPFGNDLLLTVLIARNHALAWEYTPIAASGSVLGIMLLDLVCRSGGEAGLKKMVKKQRFDQLKRHIDKRAVYAVSVACIAPPPFPFTAVIAAASAFQYPRQKLFSVAFVARLVRFSIVAALAVVFGREILSIAKSDAFFWTMIAFIGLSLGGSAYSVIGWIRRSRKPRKS